MDSLKYKSIVRERENLVIRATRECDFEDNKWTDNMIYVINKNNRLN